MNRFGPWLIVALALAFLYLIRAILPPFIIAAILAYILVPGVNALAARFHVRRAIVVLGIYALVLVVLGALFWSLRPTLMEEIRGLRTDSTQVVQGALVALFGSETLDVMGYTLHAPALAHLIVTQMQEIFNSPNSTFQFVQALAQRLGEIGLTFIALFYFLLDSERVVSFAFRFVPPLQRPNVNRLARPINAVLEQYLRGQLILIGVIAALTWVVLEFYFHLRFALLIGIATGFLEIVPLIGPVVAASLAATVALSAGGAIQSISVIVFYTILLQIEDQLIAPNVLGRAVNLHPLAAIFAVLAGGVLAGPLGLVLGVPVAAAIKIILDAVQQPVDPGALLVVPPDDGKKG
jgi:predicted PurR-regulated permease PerM